MVDIGTNSVRLLIMDGPREIGRWVEVTGLGKGVDTTGELATQAVERTLEVLHQFGSLMDQERAGRRLAIATSASRDASNREEFFDRCQGPLGVRPTLISGHEEARLAYEGALSNLSMDGPVVVSDIGGGSTEFVWADGEISVDIGSVRLTDRVLTDRPASSRQLAAAVEHVRELMEEVPDLAGSLVGVAGTWTSLAAIDQELEVYERERVDGHILTNEAVATLVELLGSMSLEETAAIPSLDPKRAPVILSGAVVASEVMARMAVADCVVSEHDTLDGAARRLMALA